MSHTYSPNHLPIHYDYYLATSERWAEILPHAHWNSETVITELCSGWSPKIGLALVLAHFMGKFIAIDHSARALHQLTQLLKPVEKKFTFETTTQDIMNAPLPESSAFILNHILDDIILFTFWDQKTNTSPYDDIEKLREFWSDPIIQEKIQKALPNLANTLAWRLLSSLQKNGEVFLHQYQGYQEKLYEIEHSHRVAMQFQKLLVEELSSECTISQRKSKEFPDLVILNKK
jgi:hypothetical protein